MDRNVSQTQPLKCMKLFTASVFSPSEPPSPEDSAMLLEADIAEGNSSWTGDMIGLIHQGYWGHSLYGAKAVLPK